MSGPSKAAVDAAFDRSMNRLAKAAQVNPPPPESTQHQEETMSKSAAAVVLPVEKTAAAPGAPSPSGPTVGGGSQLETAIERGDYATHQQAVGDQAAETSGHAPDGTKPRGSQVHSMELQDVSYTQGGAGGAKIADKSKALIIALAKNNPKGVEILADHIRLADGIGVAAAAPGNVGAPVGGKPEAVEEADEELEVPATDAAPAPGGAPAAPAAQDPTAVHLQDKIQEKTDQLNMEQEVVRELKDVMTEVQAAKADEKKDKADKAKAEKEKKEKAEKKDKAASTKTAIEKDDPSKKVPHASIDPDEHDQTPQPDQALYSESKGKSKSTPESATGQQFAEFKDKDYTLAQKVKRAQRLLAKEALKLVEAGMRETAALKQVMASKLGKAVTAASLELKSAGEESPADKDAAGPNKNTYSGEDAGDQGTDDVSKGTDTRYESPETGKTVDQARSKLDAKHNADSQGSTTAGKHSVNQNFFTLNERKQLVAEVKETDNTYDAFKQVATKMLSAVANPEVTDRVKAVTSSTLRDLKAAGDKLEAVLKTSAGDPTDVRRKAAHAAIENRLRREAAHEKATMIAAMATESTHQAARLARVPEALKLALAMVQKGHIAIEQAPTKLSEFMKMGAKEFVTVRQYALELPATNGRHAQGLKTAARLPNFGQESTGPRDELDGIFD